MKQVAPVPTPCPSWTGFEIGGFGAYTYGQIDTHTDLTGTWELFHDAEVAIQDRGNRSLNTSGGEIGGIIGYNYQFGGNWVVGAEFDGGYMFLRDSKDQEFITDFNRIPTDFTVAAAFKTHYLLTVGPKLGYAFCNWLPYITGGGAWADVDFEGRIAEPGGNFRFDRSVEDTRTGWFVGGGVEYMLNNHWRLRAQYQYIDFGETGFTRMDNLGLGFISHRSIDMREDNAQFAIIYSF